MLTSNSYIQFFLMTIRIHLCFSSSQHPCFNHGHSLWHPQSDYVSNHLIDSLLLAHQNKKETAVTLGLMKYALTLPHSDCSAVYTVGSSHLCFLPQICLFFSFLFIYFFHLDLFLLKTSSCKIKFCVE